VNESTTDDVRARVGWIQVDCGDPERLARFWGALLGVGIDGRIGSSPAGPRYLVLERQRDSGVALSFQWVPEPKRVKNRLHLDVTAVGGLEEVTRLVEELGGFREPDGDFAEGGWQWRVMVDPEGNEFCLVPPSE
jgi:predicted enzyme related to lactoylglutathione lyase